MDWIPLILSLFIFINGECYEGNVGFAFRRDGKELIMVSNYFDYKLTLEEEFDNTKVFVSNEHPNKRFYIEAIKSKDGHILWFITVYDINKRNSRGIILSTKSCQPSIP